VTRVSEALFAFALIEFFSPAIAAKCCARPR
jgi:hypothetical protein